MIQMLHRWILRILSKFAAFAGVAVKGGITLAVHGTVGRGVDPLASALATGVQSADHVDLLVGIITGRRDVVAFVVQTQLTKGIAQRATRGAAARRRLATGLPFGSQRRQVHRYALKSRNDRII